MGRRKEREYLYGDNEKWKYITGISNNILKRFETHLNEKGAKCLRGKGPLKLSWFSKANYSHCGSRCDKM